MTAIADSREAPHISLVDLTGVHRSLVSCLSEKPCLIAFFKTTCPVCELTFPFLERLHRRHDNIAIWGISQDDRQTTGEFAREKSISFPLLLDEDLQCTAAYSLTNVPSLFLVGRDGYISKSIFGFVKEDLEELNRLLTGEDGKTDASPLFTDADEVPAFRPG